MARIKEEGSPLAFDPCHKKARCSLLRTGRFFGRSVRVSDAVFSTALSMLGDGSHHGPSLRMWALLSYGVEKRNPPCCGTQPVQRVTCARLFQGRRDKSHRLGVKNRNDSIMVLEARNPKSRCEHEWLLPEAPRKILVQSTSSFWRFTAWSSLACRHIPSVSVCLVTWCPPLRVPCGPRGLLIRTPATGFQAHPTSRMTFLNELHPQRAYFPKSSRPEVPGRQAFRREHHSAQYVMILLRDGIFLNF